MADYKKGDRVRATEDRGETVGGFEFTVEKSFGGVGGGNHYYTKDGTEHYVLGRNLELVPHHTPITPKVGDRFRVVKVNKHSGVSTREVGHEFTIKAGFLDDNLNLTSTGEEAMQFIAFEANKKALVEMAEADIKEVEDAK